MKWEFWLQPLATTCPVGSFEPESVLELSEHELTRVGGGNTDLGDTY